MNIGEYAQWYEVVPETPSVLATPEPVVPEATELIGEPVKETV